MDSIFSSTALKKGQLEHWYASLDVLGLFSALPEASFDKWTKIASILLNTPVSLFSVIDENRQFFKSQTGLAEPWASARETPLSHSFCKIVRDTGERLVVVDSREDARVKGNKAIDEMNVIAYLGAPVTMPDGQPIAALCAIDGKPRQWTDHQREVITALADAVSTEVSLRVELSRRKTAQQQLEQVLHHLNMFTALVAPDGAVMWTNSERDEEKIGSHLLDTPLVQSSETAREQLADALDAARRDGTARTELNAGVEPNNAVYDVTISRVDIERDQGRLLLFTAIDITDRAKAEERRQLLTREMAHRLRNLVSVITTVASQTISKAADLKTAELKLRTRLLALARSHEMLLSNDWHGADLSQLLADELKVFESRFTLHGPSMVLEPQEAQTFALIAHELATNASKYGALSNDNGRLAISWETDASGKNIFHWREEGGPPAERPERTGFGSTILSHVAQAQFQGLAELDYTPDGFSYRLVWPAFRS